MRCEEVQEMLPSYARGEDALSLRRHLARCPGCRAELERYRALTSSLTELRGVHAEPPPGLLESLVAIPGELTRVAAMRSHVARHRKAYVSGVAVAALGAATAAVWRSRRAAPGLT